jgi:hypothetical protein
MGGSIWRSRVAFQGDICWTIFVGQMSGDGIFAVRVCRFRENIAMGQELCCVKTSSNVSSALEILDKAMQYVGKLVLHGDHLFAHVQGDFGAFEIDAHVSHQ